MVRRDFSFLLAFSSVLVKAQFYLLESEYSGKTAELEKKVCEGLKCVKDLLLSGRSHGSLDRRDC